MTIQEVLPHEKNRTESGQVQAPAVVKRVLSRATDADVVCVLPPAAMTALSRRMPQGKVIGEVELLRRPLISCDNSHKFMVRDADGRSAQFVDWSSTVAPESTLDSSLRASAFRNAVGEVLGRWVVVPTNMGTYEGRSCTTAEVMQSFSSNRVLGAAQRRHQALALMGWLAKVAACTARPATADEIETLFASPLHTLTRLPQASDQAKALARASLRLLRARQWKPHVQAAHYDLRRPNIMLSQASPWAEPRIVDWGGARVVGHGFYDLLCLGQSMGVPVRLVRWFAARSAYALGQPLHAAAGSSMATVGFLLQSQPNLSPRVFDALLNDQAAYCMGVVGSVPAPQATATLPAEQAHPSGWHATSVQSLGYALSSYE